MGVYEDRHKSEHPQTIPETHHRFINEKMAENDELTAQMFVATPAEMCTLAVACTVSMYIYTPTHFFTVIIQLCRLVIFAEDVLSNLAL